VCQWLGVIVAALCILPWHCEVMLWHCSSNHSIVLCSTALHIMPWPCSLYCSIALHAAAFCIMPWQLCFVVHFGASCQAFCFVPWTLHFVPQHWQWHCMSSNSATCPTFAPFTFIEKWRNNQLAMLVKVFIGGILMPQGSVGAGDLALFNTALKN